MDPHWTRIGPSFGRTLKANIAPSRLGLSFVRHELTPVQYSWRRDEEQPAALQHGFLAQDVESTPLRAAVRGTEGAKSLDYTQILAPAVRAIQELADQVDEQAAQLREARAMIQAQSELLSRLEARLAIIEVGGRVKGKLGGSESG